MQCVHNATVKFEIHVHIHHAADSHVTYLLERIAMNSQEAVDKVNELSGKLDTANAALATANVTLDKVKAESTASVAAIEALKQALADAQAAGGKITPELEAAINAASNKAAAVDIAATTVDAAAQAADAVVVDTPTP